MMSETKEQEIPLFIKDGEKLAKTQILANALVKRLTSGNFWSAEEYASILERSLFEVKKITH